MQATEMYLADDDEDMRSETEIPQHAGRTWSLARDFWPDRLQFTVIGGAFMDVGQRLVLPRQSQTE